MKRLLKIGERVRLVGGRVVRYVVWTDSESGSVKLNKPLCGLRWWHSDELRRVANRRRAKGMCANVDRDAAFPPVPRRW